jgi:hypothetical protein
MLVQGCTCGLHGRALAMSHEAAKRLRECALNCKPARRLPNKPQKPYSLVPRRQKTTIAVSIAFKNGVLFAADRLITIGDPGQVAAFGYYDKKIWSDSNTFYSAAMSTGCGSQKGLRWFGQTALPKLLRFSEQDKEEEDFPTAKPTLELVLNDVPEAFEDDVLSDGTTFFVGYSQLPGELETFVIDRGVIRLAEPFEVVGIGENSAIRHLQDLFHRPETMTIEEAAALGVLIIQAGKHFCPQYCGGTTDICALKRGNDDFYSLDEKDVTELENYFKKEWVTNQRDLLNSVAATLHLKT